MNDEDFFELIQEWNNEEEIGLTGKQLKVLLEWFSDTAGGLGTIQGEMFGGYDPEEKIGIRTHNKEVNKINIEHSEIEKSLEQEVDSLRYELGLRAKYR